MLEENFLKVYDKFKMEFFRRLFSLVREREGSLSAMEAFSVEIFASIDDEDELDRVYEHYMQIIQEDEEPEA